MEKKRVLIAEDELLAGESLKHTVQDFGCEVVALVATGAEAVTKALELKPDFLLMDIFLADDITGIEAVREIQRSERIPVIYITGSEDPLTRKLAAETDFLAFLGKPVQVLKLKSFL